VVHDLSNIHSANNLQEESMMLANTSAAAWSNFLTWYDASKINAHNMSAAKSVRCGLSFMANL
jgi:hypothetical protein